MRLPKPIGDSDQDSPAHTLTRHSFRDEAVMSHDGLAISTEKPISPADRRSKFLSIVNSER
jgi:hypothetical protein